MNKQDAVKLILIAREKFAGKLDKPSKLNSSVTIGQGLGILDGALSDKADDYLLSPILEKRVYQITGNRKQLRR